MQFIASILTIAILFLAASLLAVGIRSIRERRRKRLDRMLKQINSYLLPYKVFGTLTDTTSWQAALYKLVEQNQIEVELALEIEKKMAKKIIYYNGKFLSTHSPIPKNKNKEREKYLENRKKFMDRKTLPANF
jgi:K+-transporting ATPase A subunit